MDFPTISTESPLTMSHSLPVNALERDQASEIRSCYTKKLGAMTEREQASRHKPNISRNALGCVNLDRLQACPSLLEVPRCF